MQSLQMTNAALKVILERRKRTLITASLLGMTVLLFVLAVINLFDPRLHPMAVVDFASALFAVSLLVYFRLTKKIESTATAFVWFIMLLLMGLLSIVENRFYAFFWLLTFPPVAFFLKGLRQGIMYSSIFFGYFGFLVIQRFETWEPDPFNWFSVANISLASIITIALILVYEKSRSEAETMLQEKVKELSELNASLEEKISEAIRKYREQQEILIRQNKMAAMGEMISAIAHQIKQPISTISLSVQNLEMDIEDNLLNPTTAQQYCDMISDRVRYMTATIHDFRDFFKTNKVRNEFSLKKTLEASINLIQHELQNQSIKILISGDDFTISGNSRELQQVLIILITNAKDALVANNNSSDREINIRISSDALLGRIEVADNAGGIPEDIMDMIFTPYFSTKEETGMGIGLYLSRLIIEESFGGTILASNSDDGADFTLTVPRLLAESK